MKIRRYLAQNAQEAILKVRMDLGREAIVLNTKNVRRKGLWGFFTKPMVEVLAAVDDNVIINNEREDIKVAVENNETQNNEAVDSIKCVNNKFESNKAENSKLENKRISELENKISTIEAVLSKLYEQIKNGKSVQSTVNPVEINNNVIQVLKNNLARNEVDTDIINKIIATAGQKLKQDNISDTDLSSVTSAVYDVVNGMLGKPNPISLNDNGKPTVVIFVGPTGVGKTTTLAKIAANFSLGQGKKVGLITADTYRIAAVDQLKTYAEILAMPLSIVYSPTEIKDAIDKFSDKDVILIDTAGRSHKNKAQFEELKTLVSLSNADEVLLVISATTSRGNCKEIVERYGFLNNYKLLFTKLDETSTLGTVLNVKYLTNKELTYFAIGQSVPDDIEVAEVEKVTRSLLGNANDSIRSFSGNVTI